MSRPLTPAQRETLDVLSSFGSGRSITEYGIHMRAITVIPDYGQRESKAWHGRLAKAVEKGWAYRSGAAGNYRWRITDRGEAVRADDLSSRASKGPSS